MFAAMGWAHIQSYTGYTLILDGPIIFLYTRCTLLLHGPMVTLYTRCTLISHGLMVFYVQNVRCYGMGPYSVVYWMYALIAWAHGLTMYWMYAYIAWAHNKFIY